MHSLLESFKTVLANVCIYLCCHAMRLLVYLMYFFQKPQRLPPVTDEILMCSATSLAAAIRHGKIKSVDLVLAYIQRILEVEPIINAVIDHCFNDALRDAEAADLLVVSCTKSVKQLSQEKPLLGVPFSVKDGIAVQDMLQDAGSLMYEGNRSTDDSPAVALMRAAGAIPLLVTNVPELCIWGDTHNLLYGTTVNPHDTRRGPGGSSGGEGSLLASAGSLIGLGTDMVGGVRIPAAYCGVFGHKPTSGVVPNTGLLPDVGENMREYNCVGPMTRYSEDLLLVLKVLAGSEAYQLRLEEEVRLERLKVFFTETDGRVFCSYVTAEARQAVIKASTINEVDQTHT
ncbi:fatty-acid amide hydrolase 2-A-like [Amblyomma americanum]